MHKTLLPAILGTAVTLSGGAALAEAQTYMLDPSHSQIVFSYNHAGFSTSHGMFSGFEGEIQFDSEDPAASSVSVSFPADTMITGWQPRSDHFLQSGDFFKLGEFPEVTFESTSIELMGETTARITGDLTLNGVTKPLVLDAEMTKSGEYPFPPHQGKAAAGFNATGTVVRSDFNLGMFAPFVSDEVQIDLSIEAIAAE
ncbi:YceI family protein [Oceaniglobus trochenteri]|uniref:YceI family protein n=1 Tax=Oceaniglobus trochenteri TaxID=2763260 RepID=UPI001CFFFB95|nr:YceI family protein [Oceaniglobus trochenteri]